MKVQWGSLEEEAALMEVSISICAQPLVSPPQLAIPIRGGVDGTKGTGDDAGDASQQVYSGAGQSRRGIQVSNSLFEQVALVRPRVSLSTERADNIVGQPDPESGHENLAHGGSAICATYRGT